MRGPDSRVGSALGAWGVTLLAAFLAFVAAAFATGAGVPGSLVAWAAMLPVVVLGAATARPGFGDRALLLASVLALMALPPVAAGAEEALGAVLVSARPGYGSGGGFVVGAMVGLVAAFAAPLAAFPLAWKPWRRLDAVMRALAYAAMLGAVILAAAAAARAARRPDPDAYVASLPLLASLASDSHASGDGDRVHLARRDGGDCAFDVVLREADGRVLDQIFTSGALSGCGKLGVRRDDARGLWIFTNEDGARPSPLLAVDAKTHATVAVDVAMVRASLSAPPAWVALAFAGALAGAAVLAWGRRATRPLRERIAGIEATHAGGGTLQLGGDALPVVVASAAELPAGPVVLVGAAPGAAASYRESGAALVPREIVPGTLADARAALGSARASHHAFALIATLLAATPLVVAAHEHLAF